MEKPISSVFRIEVKIGTAGSWKNVGNHVKDHNEKDQKPISTSMKTSNLILIFCSNQHDV
jgi:hypothetical protein